MKFDYMSRNCKDPKMYENVYNLRVKLKKEMGEEEELNGKSEKYYKLKSQQEALKLILNTTYGAMKNKYNALFDEYNASSLCYLGQLLLAALANRLFIETNCKIIQTNTDGVLIKCNRSKISDVEKIVREWEDLTRMSMEFENIELFFQRDVNNYIEVKSGGKVKLKGKWANQADEKRALSNLNAPITHKAILEYYLHDTPIEKTIYSCNNLFDFCFTSKTGNSYDKTYHYINGEPRLANKVNRVVATTNSSYGTLKKYKKEDGKERFDKIADLPEHSYLVNGDLDMIFELDKQWYVDFANNKIKELKEI
jgi:DNA polymerase elongation subunit (family B)